MGMLRRAKDIMGGKAVFRVMARYAAAAVILCGGCSDDGLAEALWNARYALTVDASPSYGGEVSGANSGMRYGSGKDVTVTAKAASGYVFEKWSGASTSTSASVTVTMDGDKSLTANFKAKPLYNVTYDGNGTTTGVPSAVSAVSGSTIILSGQGNMTRAGYNFGGWNTSSAGTGANYAAGSSYSVTGHVTLYAKWTAYPVYTVNYDGNGATAGVPQAVSADSGSAVTLPSMTRTGYDFVVWSTGSFGAGTAYTAGSSYTVTGNIIFYARWTLNIYTITFNANGGSVTPASGVTGDGWKLLSLPVPARDGYTFDGWFTDAAEKVTTGTVFNENAAIYAGWTAIPTYTLTVDRNPSDGGSTTPSSSQSNISAGTQVNISATESSGYTFSGWTISGNGSIANANNASTSVTVDGDVTVTANFTQNPVPDSTFTDGRDGKTYRKVPIGGKEWMAENLNYETTTGSWCYDCDKYGRLYNWSTAMTACPSGWHLPSREEWDHLAESAGGRKYDNWGTWRDWYDAGKNLKSTSGWNSSGNGTDVYGFLALPGGYRYSGGSFDNAGYYGNWWTATENGASEAYGRDMGYRSDAVGEYTYDKENGLSVRCVGD
jgi:uncharacterized protein (TIGR02145 family)/uncharacterized repeat protein (TIGR02543 family)